MEGRLLTLTINRHLKYIAKDNVQFYFLIQFCFKGHPFHKPELCLMERMNHKLFLLDLHFH